MKTRHAIEVLKAGWLCDLLWDIETTPGFEADACELHASRLAPAARWKAAKDAHEAAIDAEADRLGGDGEGSARVSAWKAIGGTHGLLRLVRQLETMQQRHHAVLLHLTEDRSQAAWRVLTGRGEP